MSSIHNVELRSHQPTRAEVAARQVNELNATLSRRHCLAFGHPGHFHQYATAWEDRNYRLRWDHSQVTQATLTVAALLRGEERYVEFAGEFAGIYGHYDKTFSRDPESYEDTRAINGGLVLGARVKQLRDGSSTPATLATTADHLFTMDYHRPNLHTTHFQRVVGYDFIKSNDGKGFVYREGMTDRTTDDVVGQVEHFRVDLTGADIDYSRPVLLTLEWRPYKTVDEGLSDRPAFIDDWGDRLPAKEDEKGQAIPMDTRLRAYLLGFSIWGRS